MSGWEQVANAVDVNDEPTEVLGGGGTARLAVYGAPGPGIDVVWSREGTGPAAVSGGGDVLVTDSDALGRRLRARDADGAGEVVVELQRDVVDGRELPVTWGDVGNHVVHAIWRRAALHGMVEAEDSGAPPSLGFEPLPPLLVCRERGLAFHPPSPASGRADGLVECTDEEVLAHGSLPGWSATLSRFVYDRHAAQTTSHPRFYTADEGRLPGSTADVARWDGFVRDLGRLARPAPEDEGRSSAVRDQLPCVGCPDVTRCFPRDGDAHAAGPPLAARRLEPVALHPFFAITARAAIVRFDEHADILGGAPWTAFRARHAPSWTERGARLVREELEHSAAFVRRRAPSPLRALRDKLALFEAVVAEVARYHRRHGQPHLALSPRTVVSHAIEPDADGCYDVSLRGGVRGVMLQDLMPPPPGPALWLPPPGPVAPYAHTDVQRAAEPRSRAEANGTEAHADGFRHGRDLHVRVSAGRVWEDDAHGTVECELDVTGFPLGTTEMHESDRIRIRLDGAGWEGVTLWCRPDLERVVSEAVPLRVFPTRLDSGQILDLRAAATGRALFGTGAVYRSYGAWYDVHALGVMLLRALLANGGQSVERLMADAVPGLVPFCRAVRATDGRTAFETLVDVLADVAGSPPLDAFLAPENVCYLPAEQGAAAAAVPPGVWAEVLATIVACITHGTRASLCRGTRADADRDAFCAPVEELLARVRDLRTKLPEPTDEVSGEEPTGELDGLDPRDARIEVLSGELRASADRIARLESELESLRAAHDGERPAVDVPDTPEGEGGAAPARACWDALFAELVGKPRTAPHAPTPDSEEAELIRAVAGEGLAALSGTLAALAELGGQEFALSQRNLARTVRQALGMAADEVPGHEAHVAAALRELRAARATVGSAIGLLVEAHGKSSTEGARQMLLTLSYAMRKELGLSPKQNTSLADLLRRMEQGLPDLVARLYEPGFQAHVRDRLAARSAPSRRTGRDA